MMALLLLLGLAHAAESTDATPPELVVLYQGQEVSPQAFATLVGDHTTLTELSRQRARHRAITAATVLGGTAIVAGAWIPMNVNVPSMPDPDDHLPERADYEDQASWEAALVAGQGTLDTERKAVAMQHRARGVATGALIVTGLAVTVSAPLVSRKLKERRSRMELYYNHVDASLLAASRPELYLRVLGNGLEAGVEF